MISVPNLRLLLSGSKFLISFFLVVFFASCYVTKPVINNKPTVDKEKESRVDTMLFELKENPKVITEYDLKPNLEFGRYQSFVGKKNFNILILAPFQNDRFVRYYTGFKSAAEQYSGNVNFTIKTRNFENSTIEDSDLDNVDFVVGPYRPDDIMKVSEQIVSRDVIMLSPWLSGRNIQKGEHYIEMGGGLDLHFRTIFDHALKSFTPNQILILARNDHNDTELVKGILDSLNKDGISSQNLNTYYVNDINGVNLVNNLQNYVSERGIRCVVIPHWRDKLFLHGLIGRVNVAKRKDRDLALYLLPQVLDIEDLDYSYLQNMNTYVSTTKSPYIREAEYFDSRFFSTYGIIPDSEVYYGRDNFVLLAEIAEKINVDPLLIRDFQCINCYNRMHFTHDKGMNFSLQDEVNIKNQKVTLLYFDDYKFVKVN